MSKLAVILSVLLLAGCTTVTISAGWGQFNDCARDWQLAHPYREWVQQTTGAPVGQTKIDRMRADFGECRALVYPTAQLTVLREDGTFSWNGADPEANKKLKLCLKQKGYRIDS